MGQEDPLEEGMATHSSILAWRIPWTEEAGGLQSVGSQRLDRLKLLGMHGRGRQQWRTRLHFEYYKVRWEFISKEPVEVNGWKITKLDIKG